LLNRKCRAEYIKTLAIFNLDGKKEVKGFGKYRDSVVYEVGKITKADSFDDDFFNDCTNGIHFFLTRYEAEQW